MLPRTYRRVTGALLLAGLLLISPPAASGGLVWDLGILCGYVAVVLLLCLYIYPLRGDGLPHSRLMGLSQHRLLGWYAAGAAALHIVVLVIWQPLTIRYLVPSAPLFMWCGAAAAVLIGLLVQTGLSARAAMRRSGPASPRTSATLHIILSAIATLAVMAHTVGSGQLVRGPIKIAAVCLILALPLVWFSIRRRTRHSQPIAFRRSACASAALLILCLPSAIANRMVLQPVMTPPPIRIDFPHDKHVAVSCTLCHHNFTDTDGVGSCVACHRSQRADLPQSSEATFHLFCRDCHARMAVAGLRHGPTRACSECHPDQQRLSSQATVHPSPILARGPSATW